MYLKEAVRILQHFIAGRPVNLSLDLPVAISSGIPKIIPGYIRARIRAGDPLLTQVSLTVLSVYRVLKVPGKLKLESISDPFKGTKETLDDSDLSDALQDLLPLRRGKSLRDLITLRNVTLHKSGSSGPNSSSSLRGL